MGKIRQFLVGATKNSFTILGLWFGLEVLSLGVEATRCIPEAFQGAGTIPVLLAYLIIAGATWVSILMAGCIMELRRVIEW